MRVLRRQAIPQVIGFGVGPLTLFAWWTMHDGGYASTDWYPGLLYLTALLCVTTGFTAVRSSRAVSYALLSVGGYVGWSYLSILWSSSQADALEGSNRALLAFVSFWLFCRLRAPRKAADLFACALLFVAASLAAVLVVSIALGDRPERYFLDGRLAVPLADPDADAGLFLGAALSAAVVASRVGISLLARSTLVAASGLLVSCCVLTESRGWLFTLPVVLVTVFAIARERARLLVFLMAAAASAVCLLPSLTRVYRTNVVASPHEVGPRAAASAHAMLFSSLALGIVTAVAITCASRFRPPRIRWRLDRRVLAASATVAVLGVGGVVVVELPGLDVGGVFSQSASSQLQPGHGASRFAQLGSARYDIWRVGLQEFSRHPLLGLGQDNFAAAYLQERRVSAQPRWTHSLVLRLLVHTGLPGFILFAAFIVLAARTVLRRSPYGGSGRGRELGLVQTGALVDLAVWIVAGSVDWFWEYPALTVPLMALLGLACTSDLPGITRGGDHGSVARNRRRVSGIVGAVAFAAVAAVVVPLYLSARDLGAAEALRVSDPTGALSELRASAELNPLTAEPALQSALTEIELDDDRAALRYLDEAVSRDPQDWIAHLDRGLLEPARSAMALSDIAMAHDLNPREPLTGQALDQFGGHHRLTVQEVGAELLARDPTNPGG